MASCIEKRFVNRIRIFNLDACGRIFNTGLTVLDNKAFESLGFANNVEEGEEEAIRGVSGQLCGPPFKGCPQDKGATINFIECVENWALQALFGYGSLHLTAGVVTGFHRELINCNAKVAMEVLVDLPGSCDGANAQCLSIFFPLIREFSDTNERLLNGLNVLRGTYAATAYQNARVFENYVGGIPTGELAHLAPYATEINAGNAFYYDHVLACPIIGSAESCELRALVV